VEFKIDLVRPIFAERGRLRAEASMVHGGKRVSTAESRLLTSERKVVAHGSNHMHGSVSLSRLGRQGMLSLVGQGPVLGKLPDAGEIVVNPFARFRAGS
jgi:hypothetical protein